MKNLLVFVHSNKKFKTNYYRNEMEFLAKVQIDNSLDFGWKREDIMMVTNFPYEYNGVKTIIVSDDTFSVKKRSTSKLNAIIELIDRGIINDELHWFHDFDAVQNAPVEPIDLEGRKLAITNTSVGDTRISTGIMFFNKNAKDIFVRTVKEAVKRKINEEQALNILLKKDKRLNDEIKLLNISHNFAIRKRPVEAQYIGADKPIKVLHFHPFDERPCDDDKTKNSWQVVCGDNHFNTPLIGETLRKNFLKHGL